MQTKLLTHNSPRRPDARCLHRTSDSERALVQLFYPIHAVQHKNYLMHKYYSREKTSTWVKFTKENGTTVFFCSGFCIIRFNF